jgi:hypothetical protein
LLSDQERNRVERSPTIGPDIIDIWAKLRGLTFHVALVDLARKCNFLLPDEDQRLLQALGQPAVIGSRGEMRKPRLDSQGRLWLGDQIIRTLRLSKRPTKVLKLIRAFQEAKWKRTIPNPFFENPDPQYVHKAVSLANGRLQVIRFSVQNGGGEVAWSFL